MERVQTITVAGGDRQLITTPGDDVAELHCLSGVAVLINRKGSVKRLLLSGTRQKLQPGLVYRLDARETTNVAMHMA